MNISEVHIKNYRSVKDEKIYFSPKCRILVGINESGKTNILNALALIDQSRKTTIADKREPLRGEDEIDESFVRFFFTLDEEEKKKVVEDMKSSVLSKSIEEPVINLLGKDYSFESFLLHKRYFYEVNILKTSKQPMHFLINSDKPKVSNKWKKISESCPEDLMVDVDGMKVAVKSYKFVHASDYPEIPSEHLAEIGHEELNKFVGGKVTTHMGTNLHKVIYWDYEESKILPSRVPLQDFTNDPEICIPLKRMFELKGIEDIKGAIENAQKAGGKSLDNLLGRIADQTSKYFHDTWKEYDNINFSLKTNGADIETSIQDKSNSFDFTQRSDGFKRFATFLLIVSARAETDALKNNLILIDEPEIGLHPKGARYLRDELIKISKENYVVFSTHSIFMIDNKLIDRHLLVKKEDEVTSTKNADPSNLLEEEVLYQALGHSIYSHLHEKNIVFEGWHDKQLFNLAIDYSRAPAGYAGLKQLFEGVGLTYAQGVSDIKYITPLFASGNRKCLILTDNDDPAKNAQKDFKNTHGFGNWKRYPEVESTLTAFTGEDFIKHTAFVPILEKIKSDNGYAVDVPDLSTASAGGKGKVYVIKQWFIANGVTGDDLRAAMKNFKDTLFTTILHSDIEADYFTYLQQVGGLIAGM